MATFDALLSPGQFKAKGKEPEQLMQDWELYQCSVTSFFIATGREAATDKVKLAVLQAVGGPDVIDLVKVVGKVQLEEIPEIVAVQAALGVAGVAGVAAVPADTCPGHAEDQGRHTLTDQSGHEHLSRLKLFQQMPQAGRPWF